MEGIERLEAVLRYPQETVPDEVRLHQLRILCLLGDAYPQWVQHRDIEDRINKSHAAVSRSITRLAVPGTRLAVTGVAKEEGLGLIETQHDAEDVRRLESRLSPKGRKLVERINTILTGGK